MFVYVWLLLAVAFCGRTPFIEFNEVHQAYSELEVNLILNENKNTVVLMGVGRYEDAKAKKNVESLLQDVLDRERYAGFALLVDCDKFETNLNGQMNLCKKNTEGARLLMFKPNPISLVLFGHEVFGTQVVVDTTDNTEPAILAKRMREAVANYVKEIEDQVDLEEFLRDTTMTKLIFFEEELLNPSYLQKVAARFMRRVDVGICDNKEIAKKYHSKFPSLIMLDYNFTSNSYDQHNFTESTHFEDRPFDKVCAFVEPHVLPNRSRDILLDFELLAPIALNISSSKQLQKLVKQDKMVIMQRDDLLKCESMRSLQERYETMFNYACLNSTEKEFADIAQGSILIFQNDIKERKLIEPDAKIESVLNFPEVKQMISTEKEADMCVEMAAVKNKIPFIAYYPLKSYNSFLVRYLSSLPAFNEIIQFCQVYNPDKFVEKQYTLKENTAFALIPQPGGQASQKVQNSGIKSFGDIKLFLREIAVTKLLKLHDETMKNRIKYITTPQQLTKNCFGKPCVLALINVRKETRAQQEIAMLSDLARDFESRFNIVWLDGHCHKEILRDFLIKPEQLSSLVFFNEKTNQYKVYAGKYWIRKEVKKWLKSLRTQTKLQRLQYSLDMVSRVCREEDEL